MAATPARTKKLPPSDLSKSDEEPPPAADQKRRQKKEKPANEIDEIFQGKKAKKNKPKLEGEKLKSLDSSSGKGGAEKKKKGRDVAGNKKRKRKGPVIDEEAQARRRRTLDGLAIYAADELGFGNPEAGGTALCPFDCSCCF